jgi:hypothetical protein
LDSTPDYLFWGKREGPTAGKPKEYKRLGPTSGQPIRNMIGGPISNQPTKDKRMRPPSSAN